MQSTEPPKAGRHSLLVLDRYQKRFGRQEPRDTRPIEVTPNPVVDEICRRYTEWAPGRRGTDEEVYSATLDFLKDIKPTSRDVRDFSLRLRKCGIAEVFGINGTFLSALIELSSDENFDVLTEGLPDWIFALGYRNRKRIVVYGDFGGWTGSRMTDGEIIVRGNVWDYAGYQMEGGKIRVEGNASNGVGCNMKKGEIEILGDAKDVVCQSMSGGLTVIHGNVRYVLGDGMKGGEVIVKGDAENNVGRLMEGGKIQIFGRMGKVSKKWKGGRIYHKGKLIRGEE